MSATTLRTRGGESPALARFHPLVREWFTRAFPAPTPAQERGWPPIADGEHSLILAPTGSGKTLAAFLWGLNGIVEDRLAGRQPSRLLYLSPLKALNYDVERNLRGPLAGIAAAAALQGLEAPEVSVAVRTGDTPAARPAADAAHPAGHPHHHPREPVPAAHLARGRRSSPASGRSSSTRSTPSPGPSAARTSP